MFANTFGSPGDEILTDLAPMPHGRIKQSVGNLHGIHVSQLMMVIGSFPKTIMPFTYENTGITCLLHASDTQAEQGTSMKAS